MLLLLIYCDIKAEKPQQKAVAHQFLCLWSW